MHAQALGSTQAGAKVPGEDLIAPWDAEDWVRRVVQAPQECLAPAQLVPALPEPCRCQPSRMHVAPVGCIPQQHYALAFYTYAGAEVPPVHFELCAIVNQYPIPHPPPTTHHPGSPPRQHQAGPAQDPGPAPPTPCPTPPSPGKTGGTQAWYIFKVLVTVFRQLVFFWFSYSKILNNLQKT